ncbi:MAG TPA: haloacid dehalogenase-like hydrolase [Acidobacteriaceae bacterium]|nr:haloacid dehalogenase-like hydrolase [Acidobacteriaceae bacterium]
MPDIRYTHEEFRRAALEPTPRIAVFDCDGTLWSGDAGVGFMNWSIEAGLLSRDASDWLDDRYRLYRQGKVSEVDICGEMVQVYAGLRDEELHRAAARYFAAHVEPQIFPELQQLIADLREAGTEIWAVSSTNSWVIEEGVRRFGIPLDRVVAARVTTKDGVITSDLVAVPTDEAKATALQSLGISRPDAVFGNSIHDAAMLDLAVHAFPVNPTPDLAERSAQRGWAVFYPEAVLAERRK